jgi:hypothetical protein
MAAKYVHIPSEAIESLLVSKGFHRTVFRSEVVYVRRHEKCPAILIKIYTSIRDGRNSARGCGEDAIRCCAVFDNGKWNHGICKTIRTFRSTSHEIPENQRINVVLDRMIRRAREAYVAGSMWIQSHPKQALEARQTVSPSPTPGPITKTP